MLFSNIKPLCYLVDEYRTICPVLNEGPKHCAVYKLMYILDGECKVTCEGHEYILKKGDFFYMPPGVVYMTDVKNSLANVNIYFYFAVPSDAPIGNNWYDYLLFDRRSGTGQSKPTLEFEDYPMFSSVFAIQDNFGGEMLVLRMARESRSSLLMSANYNSALLECLLIDMIRAVGHKNRYCVITAESIIRYVNDNIESELSCADIAAKLGYHQNYLNSVIKSFCGVTLHAYIDNKKIERAMVLLEDTMLSVTDIAYRLGYSCASRFDKVFKRATGMSPSVFRKMNV